MTTPDTVKSDIAAARIFLQKIIAGERLFMKIPAHEDDYDLVFSRVIKAAASAVELGESVREIEKVLKFYAAESTYEEQLKFCTPEAGTQDGYAELEKPILFDKGSRARKMLANLAAVRKS